MKFICIHKRKRDFVHILVDSFIVPNLVVAELPEWYIVLQNLDFVSHFGITFGRTRKNLERPAEKAIPLYHIFSLFTFDVRICFDIPCEDKRCFISFFVVA